MVGEGFTKVAAPKPQWKFDEGDFDRPRRPGRRTALLLLIFGALLAAGVAIAL